MVEMQVRLRFWGANEGRTMYSADMVRSVTFRFEQEEYRIGFIKRKSTVNEYTFDKEYILEICFPSASVEDCQNNEKKHKSILEICLGEKVIGEAKVLKYQEYDEKK